MADEEHKSGSAIVRSKEQAQSALARIAGKPKDEEVFWCMSCGFAQDPQDPSKVAHPKGLTLKFEPDEIEALGGDIRSYSGPCPVCDFMTLVPMDKFTGVSIREMDRENRQAEYQEQAKAFVDVVKTEISGGSLFDGGMREPSPAQGGAVPAQQGDLPDADDFDDGDLKPRGS